MSTEPFAFTLEQIEAQLREDPVLVTEMMGNGASREVDAALHAKAAAVQEASGTPVYVVLTRTPDGYGPQGDEEIASLLHAELGDGIYVVHTSTGAGHLQTWGDLDPAATDDEVSFSLARYTAQDEVRTVIQEQGADLEPTPASDAAAILDVAAALPDIPDDSAQVLTDEQQQAYADPIWSTVGYVPSEELEPPVPVTPGLATLLGVSVGVVVTAVAYRVLRALLSDSPPGRPRRGAPDGAEATSRTRSDARARAAEPALDRARRRSRGQLSSLEDALEGPRAANASPGAVELATGSRDVALELVDSSDLLDVVGAGALAQAGSHALHHDDGNTYRPCFLDPRHGVGKHRAPVAGGLDVPVCRPCQRAIEQGKALHPLRERLRGGRQRPYYEGSSVWARTGYGALTDDLWLECRRERSR